MINPLNTHYSMTNPATIHDEEALTTLELVGRTTAKVNEVVGDQNKLRSETEKHLKEQDNRIAEMNEVTMPEKVTAEVQEQIDNGTFDKQISDYAGGLEDRLNNLLGSVTTGSTTMDAEVIDLRTGEDGKAYTTAGESVRTQLEKAMRGKGYITQYSIRDFNALPSNSIIDVNDWTGIANMPKEQVGVCATISSDAKGSRGFQLYALNTGGLYFRSFWTVGDSKAWSEWVRCGNNDDSKGAVKNRGVMYGSLYNADMNAVPTNSIISVVDWTDIANMPESQVGTCLTLCSDEERKRGLQLYITATNNMYYRHFWTDSNNVKSFGTWCKVQLAGDYIQAKGFMVEGWYNSDLNEVPVNTIISVTDWTNLVNLPTSLVGTCATMCSDNEGKRGFQIYMTNLGSFYYRTFWTNASGDKSWTAWKCSATKEDFESYVNMVSKALGMPTLLAYPTQYAVVGRELNIYYCQLFDCVDWKAENIVPHFSYNGGGCKGYDDRISIIPTTAGTFTLQLWAGCVVGGERMQGDKVTITIKVSENVIPQTAKRVLFIGDSRTDFGRLCKYAKEQMGESITLLGSRETEGYNHEGRSGWTAEGYCTLASRNGVTNAFWNPTTQSFDFAYYMESQGYDGVEYVNILLGVNSTYSSAAPDYIEQIIESIHAYNPNIIVTVMTEYVMPFSAYYSGSHVRSLLGQLFYSKIVEKFDGRTDEKIYILPTNTAIDHWFDWNRTSVQVCQFNDETMEVIADNIHPKTCGYSKLSSVWVSFYQYMES